MSTDRPGDGLSPEVDARLSELLERWVAPRRLSAARADAIREAVLSRSAELSYEWWRVVMEQVVGVVVEARSSSVAVPAGLSAIARSLRQPGLARPEPADQPGAYRLYLRLA